ncbi:helix-turn-helix domain-containing protein [Streptomyces sp. NPDC057702]|uniref:helix-turn-helix domain-containing protein n=1 Tax=unclassified Streptomyces TaxID=2593676 RepID=UPI00368E4914
MSTDFQSARVALGAQLRELRTEADMTGRDLAEALGWHPSKVSRLETGKQTATPADLTSWAAAVGRQDLTGELKGRLAGLETTYRSWRRQLADGFRPRQDVALAETEATRMIRALEVTRIPGLAQTADYARHIFSAAAEFRQAPRDIEDAVRARMRHQQVIYEPGKSFRFLIWEGALYARSCPPEVMSAQLDRLASLIGVDTVDLGIMPFGAHLRRLPSHGFWIYDQRLVIVETLTTEMWLDDDDAIRLYERAWAWLAESAVRDHQARRLIARAQAALDAA